MQEKSLLKVALLCSLIGIFLILIISEKLNLPELDISSINESHLEKYVRIKGEITRKSDASSLLILNVQDSTGNITVIAFKEDEMLLNKGDFVEIDGIVKKYRGQLEIDAKRIKVI